MGARISSPVALALIGPELTLGTTLQKGVRKSLGRAEGSTNPPQERKQARREAELKGGVRRLGPGF
jgi:hypothetical protein